MPGRRCPAPCKLHNKTYTFDRYRYTQCMPSEYSHMHAQSLRRSSSQHLGISGKDMYTATCRCQVPGLLPMLAMAS